MYIQYYNWKNKSYELFNSCKEHLNITNCQFFYPIFSLFFNINNNVNSHKNIDLKRKYIVKKIIDIEELFEYNSNMNVKANIYDIYNKTEDIKNVFIKQISILDTTHIILNHYNLLCKRNILLPSNYNYITNNKINNLDNSCYIDCFFSYIVGLINEKNKIPTFPEYYGSVIGIGNHCIDISDDIDDLETYEAFNKGLNKIYEINVYTNDSIKCDMTEDDYKESEVLVESESEELVESESEELVESESEELVESESEEEDDYIIKFKNIPVMSLFIEKLDGTLEDIIQNKDFTIDIMISCFFQITFGLAYLQKHYLFLHNDLHVNNIMFKETNEEYLYYQHENKYFKVPTYGKIFKIIDYGRCIFTFKGRLYLNDAFSKYGEADSQYNYPNSNIKEDNKPFNPNYSFDMCRLSTTIYDEFQEINIEKCDTYVKFMELIQNILIDKDNQEIYDGSDNTFQLYIDITNKAINGIPADILNRDIFDIYLEEKKDNLIYFNLD